MSASRHVGINLLSLIPRMVGGAETAALGLLGELAQQRPAGHELSLFCLDSFVREHPEVAVRFNTKVLPINGHIRPLRVLGENSWLAAEARRSKIDVMHHMGNVIPPGCGVPGVVTIYDLQPFDIPENFSRVKTFYLRSVAPRSANRARAVITPSNFARNSVIDRFGIPPERVRIIHLGVEEPTSQMSIAEVRERYGIRGRWFVFNAVTSRHKNHEMLLRAFAKVAEKEPDVILVLTGGQGRAEETVRRDIESLGLSKRVLRPGRVPRPDLIGILRGAVALTFPSCYEGFGLPVVEAMSLGTPVLAADATALPEIVGDGGRLIDPTDVDAWAGAMLGLLDDEQERQQLIRMGLGRAQSFSWAAAAEQTFRVYRDVLGDVAS
ncbi:glycosyltransferase family 4 protein [Parafrankia sp. FMc2]|uniref:glycosyltransferase family 4 protein n=1 Tax=Parafrankia sp. FMc2 TaxID=3233196 RepID=UPI0034D6156E